MVAAFLWLHVLCMVGSFGGLLGIQLAVPKSVRNGPDVAGAAAMWFSILLGIGLLFGLSAYMVGHGMYKGGHYNMLIGVKFVILLAAAALTGMSKKPARGDIFRTLAMVLLAVAALAGVSLMPR